MKKTTFLFSLLIGSLLNVFGQKYELENGILDQCVVATTITGYSGTGYVAGFKSSSSVKLTIITPDAGLYDIYVSYENSSKTAILEISSGVEKKGADFALSTGVFMESDNMRLSLNKGDNELLLKTSGRGVELNLDYIRVKKYEKKLGPFDPLTNVNSTKETKDLYTYFQSIYGKKIISGQTELKYANWLGGVTGRDPVICGFDFMNFTADANLNVDDAINWAKNRNGIVAYHWHWRDPIGHGQFYSYPEYTSNPEGTKFDANKIFDIQSPEYTAMIKDIDYIAGQLKKLQDQNIPVLWRPLHEATGNEWNGWFWWSTGGRPKVIGSVRDEAVSAAACKQLWRVMYDRMVNFHGLKNLIWTWNTSGTAREDKWYPGNQYVDLIGYDTYGSTPNVAWESLFNQMLLKHGNKMIAMTENGSIPDPLLLQSKGAAWLYFLTWNDMIKDKTKNSCTFLDRAFHDDYVLTNPSTQAPVVCDPAFEPAPADAILVGDTKANIQLLGGLKLSTTYFHPGNLGYVSYSGDQSSEIIFTFECAKAGDYQLFIDYMIVTGWGNKGTNISVNGATPFEFMLSNTGDEKFHETVAIPITLKAGTNTVSLKVGWGYYNINYIRIPGRLGTSIEAKNENLKRVWLDDNSILHFQTSPTDKLQEVSLFNSAGQLVKTATPLQSNEMHQISCQSIPKGVYILVLNRSGIKESYKVVIK